MWHPLACDKDAIVFALNRRHSASVYWMYYERQIMTNKANLNTPEAGDKADNIDAAKRELLRRMRKGAYAAPVALAMMTTKASACSLSC